VSEEVVPSDGDEVVSGGAFDMASWFEEGYVVLGAVGSVKLINPDGNMIVHDFNLGLSQFEALGMLMLHEDEVRTSTYIDNHSMDEED